MAEGMNTSIVERALRRLGERLEYHTEVEILLVGGAAGMVAGVLPAARVTTDCDVMVCIPPSAMLAVELAAESVAGEVGLSPTWLNRDVQLRRDALPDGWIERKQWVGTFGRLRVYAASRPDLIAMKVLAGRDQDLDDLSAMRVRMDEVEFVRRYLDSLVGKGTTPEQIADAREVLGSLGGGMSMSETLDNLIRKWSSLGAGFGVEASDAGEIDLERLLLATAREAPKMARLFIMAATWLHFFGDAVAKHRLKRLIGEELGPEFQPVLGLLLDTAQQGTHPREFDSVLRQLAPASPARPLFEVSRGSEKLTEIARRRASELSGKWGLWAQPVEFKADALRPATWVLTRHPELRTRADFRGDLRASVLAALRHDAGAGASESRLAELAGGSRSQVRNALRNLELTGRVVARRAGEGNRRVVELTAAA